MTARSTPRADCVNSSTRDHALTGRFQINSFKFIASASSSASAYTTHHNSHMAVQRSTGCDAADSTQQQHLQAGMDSIGTLPLLATERLRLAAGGHSQQTAVSRQLRGLPSLVEDASASTATAQAAAAIPRRRPFALIMILLGRHRAERRPLPPLPALRADTTPVRASIMITAP